MSISHATKFKSVACLKNANNGNDDDTSKDDNCTNVIYRISNMTFMESSVTKETDGGSDSSRSSGRSDNGNDKGNDGTDERINIYGHKSSRPSDVKCLGALKLVMLSGYLSWNENYHLGRTCFALYGHYCILKNGYVLSIIEIVAGCGMLLADSVLSLETCCSLFRLKLSENGSIWHQLCKSKFGYIIQAPEKPPLGSNPYGLLGNRHRQFYKSRSKCNNWETYVTKNTTPLLMESSDDIRESQMQVLLLDIIHRVVMKEEIHKAVVIGSDDLFQFPHKQKIVLERPIHICNKKCMMRHIKRRCTTLSEDNSVPSVASSRRDSLLDETSSDDWQHSLRNDRQNDSSDSASSDEPYSPSNEASREENVSTVDSLPPPEENSHMGEPTLPPNASLSEENSSTTGLCRCSKGPCHYSSLDMTENACYHISNRLDMTENACYHISNRLLGLRAFIVQPNGYSLQLFSNFPENIGPDEESISNEEMGSYRMWYGSNDYDVDKQMQYPFGFANRSIGTFYERESIFPFFEQRWIKIPHNERLRRMLGLLKHPFYGTLELGYKLDCTVEVSGQDVVISGFVLRVSLAVSYDCKPECSWPVTKTELNQTQMVPGELFALERVI